MIISSSYPRCFLLEPNSNRRQRVASEASFAAPSRFGKPYHTGTRTNRSSSRDRLGTSALPFPIPSRRFRPHPLKVLLHGLSISP
jgi:hypothetical protein